VSINKHQALSKRIRVVRIGMDNFVTVNGNLGRAGGNQWQAKNGDKDAANEHS